MHKIYRKGAFTLKLLFKNDFFKIFNKKRNLKKIDTLTRFLKNFITGSDYIPLKILNKKQFYFKKITKNNLLKFSIYFLLFVHIFYNINRLRFFFIKMKNFMEIHKYFNNNQNNYQPFKKT